MKILGDNSLTLEMIMAYVDDVRLALRALVEGLVFCKKCKTLYHSSEQEEMDKMSEESDTQRTARVLRDIFNSIEEDLKFTVETEDDFEDKMLPTLDTKLSVVTETVPSNQAVPPPRTTPPPHTPPSPPSPPPPQPSRRDPEYLGKGLGTGRPGDSRPQPGPPTFCPPPPP